MNDFILIKKLNEYIEIIEKLHIFGVTRIKFKYVFYLSIIFCFVFLFIASILYRYYAYDFNDIFTKLMFGLNIVTLLVVVFYPFKRKKLNILKMSKKYKASVDVFEYYSKNREIYNVINESYVEIFLTLNSFTNMVYLFQQNGLVITIIAIALFNRNFYKIYKNNLKAYQYSYATELKIEENIVEIIQTYKNDCVFIRPAQYDKNVEKLVELQVFTPLQMPSGTKPEDIKYYITDEHYSYFIQ